MSRKIGVIIMGTILMFGFGSANIHAEEDGFLHRLQREMKVLGWNNEELGGFMYAAQEMSWNGVENGDPEMVALALHYCRQNQVAFQAQDRVQLAFNLAAMGIEMEALGFARRNITITAIGVSREVGEALKARTNADNTTGKGDLIRDRIRDQLCTEGLQENQERIMERLTNRVREGERSGNRRAAGAH
ncbi:MAG: hypothetical protein EHM28_08060 [Spirochaetaceae bacterium]|nr:MAG: hypothetical protein EHM28_08060 [Spirochaetaceae bacterium]